MVNFIGENSFIGPSDLGSDRRIDAYRCLVFANKRGRTGIHRLGQGEAFSRWEL